MNNCEWRSKARIVAYIELVVSSSCLVLIILTAFIEVAETSDTTDGRATPGTNIWMGIFWLFVVILFLAVCFDLWCAIMLLKATEPRANLGYALEKASTWRDINIVCLIVSIVFSVPSRSFGLLIFHIIYRGCLIYIVHNFVKELQGKTRSATVCQV